MIVAKTREKANSFERKSEFHFQFHQHSKSPKKGKKKKRVNENPILNSPPLTSSPVSILWGNRTLRIIHLKKKQTTYLDSAR